MTVRHPTVARLPRRTRRWSCARRSATQRRRQPRAAGSGAESKVGRAFAVDAKERVRVGRNACCMAPHRSASTPARNRSLLLTAVLPAALLCALLAAGVALLVAGGGKRAADKELDARAATIKKTWDTAGPPSTRPELRRLGTRVNANLRVIRGRHPQPGTTNGDQRQYGFATRDRQTLKISLSTSQSSDALSKGLVAGLIVGLAGALLLAALLSARLRGASAGAGSELSEQLQQARSQVADLERSAGADQLTGLPTGPRVRHAVEVEIQRSERE